MNEPCEQTRSGPGRIAVSSKINLSEILVAGLALLCLVGMQRLLVVFSGAVDTDIVFDYGMFCPRCRFSDRADVKHLDLKIDVRAAHLCGDRLFPDWNGAAARPQAASDAIR